jgi:hypothetical protein
MASGIVEGTNQDSSSQQSQQGQSKVKVQKLLGRSTDLPSFLRDLLTKMASAVAGTEAAGFVIERRFVPSEQSNDAAAGGPPEPEAEPQAELEDEVPEPAPQAAAQGTMVPVAVPVAHVLFRPDDGDVDARNTAMERFKGHVVPCLQQNKDGVFEQGLPEPAGEPEFCLVALLRTDGVVLAAAAVNVRARDYERARQRLGAMQLLAGQFEVFGLRRHVEQARVVAAQQQHVLQLATAVGTADGFESAAMNLCNELAQRAGAARVSLGWMKGQHIKLRALSHTEKFDKKQELILQIEKAMEECLDQEEIVRFDSDGQRSQNVTRSAEHLSRMQGGNSVLSLPLRRKDEVLGVLTLEFAPPGKVPEQMIEALAVACDVLSPQLHDRYENDRWIPVKIGHSIQYTTGLAIGRKHMLAKVIIVAVFAVAAFITFYKPMYHVSAPFSFMSIGRRPVSIPFDGKIEAIGNNPRTGKMWMPGDDVKKGELLASMNTDTLHEQLLSAESEEDSENATAISARAQVAKGDNSKAGDMREAEEKAKSAHAKVLLYRTQIKQANMVADTDGIIVRADELDTKRNLQVKLGDPLMEIAPVNEFRADLAISEKDIQNIREGKLQKVELAATSFPGDEIIAHIDRVAGPGEAKEGDNVFKVYATIDPGQQREWIRQGMAGEARVDVANKRLVWIWTHRLIEFLQLKLWM